MARTKSTTTDSSAHLGFEAKLSLSADTATRVSASLDCAATWRHLRGVQDHRSNNMDAVEYKHVVLGLIFLKYISDSFDEHHAKLVAGKGDFKGANPEDKDEPSGTRQPAAGSPEGERGRAKQYLAANVFWVPKEARWAQFKANAKQSSISSHYAPKQAALAALKKSLLHQVFTGEL